MENITYVGKVAYVKGQITVDLDLTKYGARHMLAQRLLGHMVLNSSRKYMPYQTGSMSQRSYVSPDGKHVIFPGPYARMLYAGMVMVDIKTGKGPALVRDKFGVKVGPRFREGAKLKPSDRPIKFGTKHNPMAQAHWFEPAKSNDLPYWLSEINRIIKYGE